MHYIAPGSIRVKTDPTPLFPKPHGGSVVRGDAPGSLDELIDKHPIRLNAPSVSQEVPGNGQESLYLVKLGFRFKPPDDVSIRWLRFSTEVSFAAGEQEPSRPVVVLSFFPERVAEDRAYDGPIGIDDGGVIQPNTSGGELRAVDFPAYTLGYLTRPERMVWDFLPQPDGGPYSLDNFYLSAKMPDRGEVTFLETVCMCVAHPLLGDGSFEYPATRKTLVMGRSPTKQS